MHIDLYGLGFETPGVSFYLWSPWRAAAIEVKLFESIARQTGAPVEKAPDELRIDIDDAKTWRQAVQTVARVMKGWQEEAEPGNEKRSWRWLIEGDTDADGYDHLGEKTAVWGFLRVSLDRGNLAEGEKGEDFDLDNFGFSVSGVEE
jgi:hypothetical protein